MNLDEFAAQVAEAAQLHAPIKTSAKLLSGVTIEVTVSGAVAHVQDANPWSPDPSRWPDRMVRDAARWNPNLRAR